MSFELVHTVPAGSLAKSAVVISKVLLSTECSKRHVYCSCVASHVFFLSLFFAPKHRFLTKTICSLWMGTSLHIQSRSPLSHECTRI